MPSGNIIGEVSVKVTPDTKGFAQELKAKLSKINDDFKVQVEMDTKAAQAQFKTLKQRIERDNIHAQVKLDVDRSSIPRVNARNLISTRGVGAATGFLGRMFRTIGAAAKNAGEAISAFTSTLAGMARGAIGTADGLRGIGTSLATMAMSIGQMIAPALMLVAVIALVGVALQVVIGLVMTLAGLVGTAIGGMAAGFAGLPAVIAVAGAAFGVIKLGMDGIKKAAETLRPEFDLLKSAVSNTFERGLVPVFQQLKVLFPEVQAGAVALAQQFVNTADSLAKMVTSQVGMENLRGAIAGIQVAFEQMAPGLQAVMWQLLDIAGTEVLYRILGDTINEVAQSFADFLAKLQENNRLAVALDRVRVLLGAVADMVGALALAATDFLIGAGPGVAEWFDSLTQALGRVDWKSLGQQFGEMFRVAGEAIRNIPQETIDRFIMSIENIIRSIEDFAASGGFTMLIEAFTALNDVLAFFMGTADEVMRFFGSLFQAISPGAAYAYQETNKFKDNMKGAQDQTRTSSGAMKSDLAGAVRQMGADMGGLSKSVGDGARRAANAGRDNINDGARGMADGMRRGANDVGREAGTIPGKVKDATRGDLSGSGDSLIRSFARGISGGQHWAVAAAGAVVSAVRRLFPFSPAKEGPFSGKGYTTHSGKALISDWALGMEKAAPAAVRTVENIASKVQAGMSGNLSGSISAEGYGDFTADMAAAMSGMAFTIDDRGGKVLARVVRRENNIQAVRRING